MKITSLVVALVAAGALAALGQEGTVQDIKHGAKKAGEKVKEGVETVGEKTKEAAETVGEKTKETAETVAKKTKETVEGSGDKTKETARTTHHKSAAQYTCTDPQRSLNSQARTLFQSRKLLGLESRRSSVRTCSSSASESYLAR